jgi:dTDP-4-amino-4,6-dideoxygalactose transaminase
MIKIRVGDIRISNEERAAILEVLDSGRISEGSKVREFEALWAQYTDNKYCVAVNSGTSALLAGLFALLYDKRYDRVKKGKKVITSPLTYVATSNAIVLAGMEPVYVDVDPVTFGLNVEQIEDLLKRSKSDEYAMILPVHLMGYPNDMDAINDLAHKYGLVVFEDAAQAHGSLYKGKKVGSLSLLADYSFYIAHNIQVGEMGAVVTNDEHLHALIKKIKANGRVCSCSICVRSEGKCPFAGSNIDPRFTHEIIGFNFKIPEFQAAFAIPQVRRADDIMKMRQMNVSFLNGQLQNLTDIIQLPLFSDTVSYLAYPLVIKDSRVNRRQFMRSLEEKGVETRPLFGCIPTQQPAFKYLKSHYAGLLPNAEFIGLQAFYIGCHQFLSHDDLEFTVRAVLAAADEQRTGPRGASA